MAIQTRRGAEPDFDASKMLPGEFAVTTDGSRKVYVAFAPGDVKEIASKEEVQNIVDEFDANVEQDIEDAKNEVIAEAEEQVQNVINEGYKVLESIPDDYEEASQKADEAVRTKGDAILCTASGKTIVATDSSGNYVRGLTPYGKTKQMTTNGYQLLDLREDTTGEYNGVTLVLKDEVVKITGTVTGETATLWLLGQYTKTETLFTLQPGTYTLSYGILWNYDGTEYKLKTGTFTLTEPFNVTGLSSPSYQNSETVNLTTNIMLNAGTEALPWEPYTGVLPSPSIEYNQPLENVGMMGNLCNLPDVEEFTKSGITWSCKNQRIKAKGTSTELSSTLHEGLKYSLPSGTKGQFYIDDDSEKISAYAKVTLSDSTIEYHKNKTFTLDGTEQSVDIYAQIVAGMKVDTEFGIMLNYGTTALPYRPYSGQYELESGVYGGNLLCFEDYEYIPASNTNQRTYKSDTGEWVYKCLYETIQVTTIVTEYEIKNYLKRNRYPKGTYYFSRDDSDFFKKCLINILYEDGTSGTIQIGENVIEQGFSIVDVKTVGVYQMTLNQSATFKLQLSLADSEWELPKQPQSHINLLGNGLPGIPLGTTIPEVIANSPVHMSGVYWDEEDGQYYIGDTVDNESGFITRRCEQIVVDGINEKAGLIEDLGNCSRLHHANNKRGMDYSVRALCSHLKWEANHTKDSEHFYINGISTNIYISNDFLSQYESEDACFEANPITIAYILAEPYTVPLTASEIESYKSLRSNYHVTTVMNDCGAHMEFGYNADTKLYIDNKFAELAEKLLA